MRYPTMSLPEIMALPVADIVNEPAHLYLWVPNALLPEGLEVMRAWGFQFKSLLVWHKIRKDGGSDGRGVGFYFRNVTETVLFGVRGKKARTLAPGRSQVNLIASRKREHSRKPDELYPIIEACSPGPYLELFARGGRDGWTSWGNEANIDPREQPSRPTTSAPKSSERGRRHPAEGAGGVVRAESHSASLEIEPTRRHIPSRNLTLTTIRPSEFQKWRWIAIRALVPTGGASLKLQDVCRWLTMVEETPRRRW